MTFALEDIKRLIPEATSVVGDGLMFRITINGRRYYSVEAITIALLTTRRQLEIAREGLGIIYFNDVNPKTSDITPLARQRRMAKIAKDTLESIKKVGEA